MLQVSFQEQRWIPPKRGSFNISRREQGLTGGEEAWKLSIYIEERR